MIPPLWYAATRELSHRDGSLGHASTVTPVVSKFVACPIHNPVSRNSASRNSAIRNPAIRNPASNILASHRTATRGG